MRTLNKKRLQEPIILENYTATWREERPGYVTVGGKELSDFVPRDKVLATHFIPGKHQFDTIAIVQLSSSEAKQLGLKTALGAITGTQGEKT